ncbi:hypothetical protein SK128_002684 [Halocaridina rubra]|uniref:N-acetylglucosamine-1-phosphotransferase subunits alpha/beta n=1 Tax=Halocaridina rubra TaxID=373956 RepID=A0AAN8WUX9_HALRR
MKNFHKCCHRFLLDAVLTNPPPLVAVVLAVFLSVFAVGFWCAHWIDQVDLAAYKSFNVFSDNIKGENLVNRISSGLPIDVVYTWVNGSDPTLLLGLNALAHFSHNDACPLSHCLPAPYFSFLDDKSPNSVVEEIFASSDILDFERVASVHNNLPKNFTVVHLYNQSFVRTAQERVVHSLGNHSQPTQAYWTSDVGGGWGMKKRNSVIVTGAGNVSSSRLLSALFPEQTDISTRCSVFGTSAVQVIECNEPEVVRELLDTEVNPHVLPDAVIKVRPAMLLLQPDKDDHLKEVDANRFEDNEELRYSLRSLEKYAPWVRRIYLVTSGQIPYWINLDHPKLMIVTHEEIFQNKSHLPTYSSPAIESHIHRIHGLSENFLYLNDDVMLGSEVWPEDFYSPATGFKVYLSWSLPECSSGCPGSWLNDGYCDRSCNTSACEWDGGDCANNKEDEGMFEGEDDFGSDLTLDFCAPSCSDLWISDKYCDHSCNVRACGFDGGDCGLEDIKSLHEIPIPVSTNTSYILPKGVFAAWMNISKLLGEGKTVQGRHTDHAGLRSMTVNTAQGILFLLLRSNISTFIRLELEVMEVKKDQFKLETARQFNLTLIFNTSPSEEIATKTSKVNTQKPIYTARNFTFDRVAPDYVEKKLVYSPNSDSLDFSRVNVTASKLPAKLAESLLFYELLYENGDISPKAFRKKKSFLISKFMEENPHHNLMYHGDLKGLSKGNLDVSDEKEFDHAQPRKVERKQFNENKETTNKTGNGVNIFAIAKNDSLLKATNMSAYRNLHKNISARRLLAYAGNARRYIDSNQWLNSEEEEKESVENILEANKFLWENAFNENGSLGSHLGNLPWERQQLFPLNDHKNTHSPGDYVRLHSGNRQLLDMFAESLLHVNRLYNAEFGYEARRVPAHMPHLINREIMTELQKRFQEEFELTSSHKIRQANDMQYAFSYFFYLLSKKRIRTHSEIFSIFDTDKSGTLSDREIRTFLTRINDLPLHYATVQAFHNVVRNCSATHHVQPIPTPVYERYSDSDLPTVSLELVLVCEPLRALLSKLEKANVYKFTQLSDDAVQFKMVTSNISIVVHMLDEVRKHPRKFICLNSNLDPKSKDNDLIHALVQDTYESLFPVPSSFELPLNYRNRFLYIKDLQAWRRWRNFIRALIYACLASLIFLTVINFFSSELENLRRKWCRRRRRRDGFSGVRV